MTCSALASALPGGLLVPTLLGAADLGPPLDAPDRRRSSPAADEAGPGAAAAVSAWFGLRDVLPEDSEAADVTRSGNSDATPQWEWLFGFGAAMARYAALVSAVLVDPASGLVSREQFEQFLADEMARAQASRRALSLLLVGLDAPESGGERMTVLAREISAAVRRLLRRADVVARYSEASLAVLLAATAPQEASAVADKILRHLAEQGSDLGCSCGVSGFDAGRVSAPLSPRELIDRSALALASARRLGGKRVILFRDELAATGMVEDPRDLAGIFSGNMARDYREMALLWKMLSSIAASTEVEELAALAVETLATDFRFARVVLLGVAADGKLQVLAGRAGAAAIAPAEELGKCAALVREERQLVEQACKDRRITGQAESEAGTPAAAAATGGARRGLAFPLVTRQQCLGCLFLEWRPDLDATDVRCQQAIAEQLAVALDRALLFAADRRRRDASEQRLRAEVKGLSEALDRVAVVHASPRMAQVLATLRRVAPTDATVLVTGESGTGKEVLARLIYELNPRRTRPLVVVDCAAIAPSLIDSELFGHERGAYTGANQRSAGRLAEADGGTLLLDEIGELPLDVQAKLLRFVQEKEVIGVGSSRPRRVDVRLIAATNRDLAAEVAAGRFRGDLYHRLNVIQLAIPPLRERKEDILPLAWFFLDRFRQQYGKAVTGFTPEAQAFLQELPWTGNVRELQNRIMRAVILAESELIGHDEFGFEPRQIPPAAPAAPAPAVAGGRVETTRASALAAPATAVVRPEEPTSGAATADELLRALREELGGQIQLAISGGTRLRYPIGRWLDEDLLMAANTAAAGVLRRGADLLGLPESTFRRRVRAVKFRKDAGLLTRPESWDPVRDILAKLLAVGGTDGLLDQVEQILMGVVVEACPEDTSTAAALMGVTTPTLRRRLGESDLDAGTDDDGPELGES
ncbi:MAG: sigma 54-interacting transcriptional regulator [Candidatus Schekmanbacteria bacterium]|nr:sigma 54-interacting transcriptional regulator [Candidatus Schekmanbacteria bacterium]